MHFSNNKLKILRKLRLKAWITHFYHSVILLNLAFLKQNQVTKDGEFQVRNFIGKCAVGSCYLFHLDMVYLTTLLLARLATSCELVGMWRSVATVSQKLIHTILGHL
jgi:hypothetical protein